MVSTVKNINTFTDYGAEAQDIERRRKMAEMLQQQALQPIEQTTAGGYVTPISWTQGLAKALQGYAGMKGQEAATQQQKDLAARAREAGASDVTSMMGALQGTPAKPAGAYGEEGLPLENPAQPAQAPDRSRALAIALQSQSPMVQSVGSQLLAQMLKGPESLFGKVDPKDYTPESVRRYATTQDPSVLVPVRKMESVPMVGTNGAPATGFVNPYAPPTNPIPQAVKQDFLNTGAAFTAVNPYVPPTQPVAIGVSPNTAFTQANENARFKGVSGNTAATNATTRRGQDIAANPDIQGNLAASRASGAELGKSSATAQINLPQTINDVAQMSNIVKQMIGDATVNKEGKIVVPEGGNKPHPGFSVSVGASAQPGFQYISGTDKANFYALKDQITSDAFLQAYKNSLKGGGSITEIEGTKGTEALLRARTSQSEPEFIKAMREFDAANQRIVDIEKGKAGNLRRRASDAHNVVRISGDAEYNALPSGATYVGPDGVTRTK